MPNEHKEIEAKFYLPHLLAIREHLIALGARLVSERILERNWRFDSKDRSLTAGGKVLRIRQANRIYLTFKMPRDQLEGRTEIEFEVEDGKKARAFLEALGFELIAKYEKYRETFRLDPVVIFLDELPFGFFVEIEGPSMKMIRESATQLKLDWEARVHSSYLQLFYGLRRRLNSTIPHATFRDFEGLREIHPEDLRLEYALPSNPS